jgi:alpha-L-arabinofuranosidase
MSRARVFIDPHFTVGPINRRLFGSFVEHLGRSVYDGVYEPKHPTADEHGFRTDVIDLVKELGVSTIRYPGGNFVSGYRWEDGVGPKDGRPRRRDLAWHSTETNEVGLHEFASWIEAVDSELMLAVNLGTRGVAEALDLLEYVNLGAGSALADRRVANGRERPFDVRMWCLGNEMDGPWQIGHCSADEYGRLASRAAKAMRQMDPTLELVVCGSSGSHMPTFGEWERTVLMHAYDDVDYISCHAYYEERDGDLASFLASAVDMDRFIEQVVATADHVRAVKRSSKSINISFDEWNVWYQTRFENEEKIQGLNDWPIAPRLLEDVYTVADAVVVGSLLISLLNHADRVTSASLAQLVNVIAPIMTEPSGPAWRQTIFHPFALTSRWARGEAMRVRVDCDDHDSAVYGAVPSLAAAVSYDADAGRTAVFLVNRSQESPTEVAVDLSGVGGGNVEAWTISDPDPHVCNTISAPDRVRPELNHTARHEDGVLSISLPPVSWTAITIGASG